MPPASKLAQLTQAECLALLAGECLGRVGVSIDALPAVFPVLIAVVDGSVVFRTVPGTKLAAASARTVVALEADHFDPGTRAGWSVLVRGVASEIDDPDRIARARELLLESWIVDGSAEHFVEVSADLVTGRRLHR